MNKPRARDLGLDIPGTCGATNSLVDVPGVLVGMTTILEGDGPVTPGYGPVRTGITAILPRGFESSPNLVWAGMHSLNGNGEMTGSHWIRDAGYFVGPVCLTNTHSVGMVHHAATYWTINQYKTHWHQEHLWALPVVAETYDGVLNDINGQHITMEHTLAAINSASNQPVAEGNVGGGTGMICYDFKGGTGSASRAVPIGETDYIIAALVQANHGTRNWFTPLGVPAGRHLPHHAEEESRERGSIIVILATDAPLLPSQLQRIARRATIGVGRGGSPGGNNSGDLFLAFTTANSQPMMNHAESNLSLNSLNDELLDGLYLGAVEAVEESVLNALVAAEDMTMVKPGGLVCEAINHGELINVMKQYGRIVD
ncbi:MAG: P1 family peptidase [Gammaproteobacteria bacterium]|nr:P1 family peptidase [Gammaproteobacteria bacterium]